MKDFIRSTYYMAKSTIRDKSFTFWTLLFPVILATFYQVALSNAYNVQIDTIPVAVQEKSYAAYVFPQIDLFEMTTVKDDKEGQELLKSKEVEVYVNKDSEMVVTSLSGLKQSIIRSILTQTEQAKALGKSAAYLDYSDVQVKTEEQKTDPMSVYFYSLFAMACFFAMFGGISACIAIQPNLSAFGARLTASPFKKSTFILSSFLVTMSVSMAANLLLYIYVVHILKVNLFSNPLPSLLLVFMGNLCGTALGYIIGAIKKLREETKSMIGVIFVNVLSAAAGMMSLDIRYLVYKHAPLFAKLNPLSVMTDTFYQINNLGNANHLVSAMAILGTYTFLALALATLLLRRNRYDSL